MTSTTHPFELDLVIGRLAIGICVWELTEPGKPESLVLRVCNESAARFLSVEIEAVLDKFIHQGFPGSLETPLPGIFTKVIESGETIELGDVPYKDEVVPDGMFSIRVWPMDERHALVEFTNVTEARRAEVQSAAMLEAAASAQAEAKRLGETTRALDEKLSLIEIQKREIQALTAPILELWTGVLALPLVGRFDRERSEVVREKLLDAVATSKAGAVVIDVTGLECIDATIAAELLRLSRALRLLGAQTYFSGISPANAMTMAHLDHEMPTQQFLRNLKQALRLALARP